MSSAKWFLPHSSTTDALAMRFAQRTRPCLSITALRPSDWSRLAGVLAVAIALRALFYTGFFGSDEVTYIMAANNIATGDWRASDYIGATRYGMNLPVALSIYGFGLSEASANLWPFLCSVGEVGIIFLVARWLWGSRAAVTSAGMLALLPLHVHFAGRMMADPPLAFFLSLSVALTLRATHSRAPWMALATGLAWGGVFWVKESVALLYLPILLVLNFYLFQFNGRWFWLFSGMALSFAANCALMNYVADNPMHIFAVMKVAVAKIRGMQLHTSPWFYLRYLFVDIRHTFLLGYLAMAGILLYGLHFWRTKQATQGTQFVVLWTLLLLGMFSLALVSVSPIQLVMKQTNYMLIFAAPLALLAGWFLSSLPNRFLGPVAAVVVAGSVGLAALEQQAVTVFTANSKSTYAYLRDHPKVYLLGTTNNERAVLFYSLMEGRNDLHGRFLSLGDRADAANSHAAANGSLQAADKSVFAVLDLQNVDWGSKPGTIRNLAEVPACWTPAGTLTPAPLGNGHGWVQGLLHIGTLLPMDLQRPLMKALQPLALPARAYLFKVEQACE